MKNTVLRRSLPEYINTVRNLSESRLNVPMESIKDLKAESFRVLKMKNKDQLGQIEKAAINHKIDLLEGRVFRFLIRKTFLDASFFCKFVQK